MNDRRAAAAEEFFADLPADVDDRARIVVGDLRALLARVNAINAQPADTSAAVDEPTGHLELRIVHPRGDPHMTIAWRPGDVQLFWTGGGQQDDGWLPQHAAIVEALLTGANSIRMQRRWGRIVATDSTFWPPSGLVGPVHTACPPPARLRAKLRQIRDGMRPGSSLTMYCQVSYHSPDAKLLRAEPFLEPGAAGQD